MPLAQRVYGWSINKTPTPPFSDTPCTGRGHPDNGSVRDRRGSLWGPRDPRLAGITPRAGLPSALSSSVPNDLLIRTYVPESILSLVTKNQGNLLCGHSTVSGVEFCKTSSCRHKGSYGPKDIKVTRQKTICHRFPCTGRHSRSDLCSPYEHGDRSVHRWCLRVTYGC